MEKFIKEGFTFDDVLLLPAYSEVNPSEISISTKITKNIKLNSPIISAAMDTVTESRMAIALARQGGIGFVHKNMTIEEQAIEVDKVKRSEHGVITDPFFLSPNHYVYEANDLMSKYHISGVPVTENGKLVGIITNRDLRFETDHNKKIYEVMTKEDLVTAPEGTTLEDAKEILTKSKIEKLPIVDDKFFLKGLITIKDIEKSIKYPNTAKDTNGRLLVGASIGIGNDMFERIEALINAKVDILSIDLIHSHRKDVIDNIKQIKSLYKDVQLVVGNVVTGEATLELIKAGADCIKVGFGAGSIATTRVITGVGIPQLSAIYDCYQVCKIYDIPIIASGGIKYSGDITKAIAAGANAVVLGNVFAGCYESPGDVELFQGRKYKVYRGSGSLASMEKGSKEDFFQANEDVLIPEGVEGRVSFKGYVKDTIYQLMGGLKAGMSYCGTKSIEELKSNGQFIKITQASLKENHPHDILITKEAANYSVEY